MFKLVVFKYSKASNKHPLEGFSLGFYVDHVVFVFLFNGFCGFFMGVLRFFTSFPGVSRVF